MNYTVILLTISSTILLYILLVQAAKKKKRKKADPGLQAVKDKGFAITDLSNRDFINQQFIGLDKSKKLLVLADLGKTAEVVIVLPLLKIAYYKMDKQTDEIVHRGRNRGAFEKILNKVSLLLFSSDDKLLFEYVFFDHERNTIGEMPGLLRKAATWKRIIKRNGVVEIA